MTKEELRDYVDEQRTLGNIPYHVYSTLIDGIDTLEQEPFINKPCVSSEVCEHDKNIVLDKIQGEIKRVITVCHASNNHDELIRRNVVLQIIEKYKAKREPQESED